MRLRRLSAVLFLAALFLVGGVAEAFAEQTLVFFRHGEKPQGGYGQLTCQGFNRSLKLPAVLLGKYGTPTYLYAPNPAFRISDSAGRFYYDRPLETLAPLAVKLKKDIRSQFAYSDIASLQHALIDPAKDGTLIFIAWEHLYLQQLVQNIMNAYGGHLVVPTWPDSDYDSLFVVRVNYGSAITAAFQIDHEGLNAQVAQLTQCGF
jgi:hypothetical protein